MAEPALFAKDASFGRSLEAQFTQFRNSIRQGVSAEEIQKQRLEIEAKLDQAAQMLAETDDFSGYYAFLNSALIILREGLEAALILAAIIAMLRVMGATHADSLHPFRLDPRACRRCGSPGLPPRPC